MSSFYDDVKARIEPYLHKYLKTNTKDVADKAYLYYHYNVEPIYSDPANKIPIDGISWDNSRLDAFRHAYTSAVFTFDQNALYANALGQLNEIHADIYNPNQTPELKNMDLWNNSVGREIGTKARSIEEVGPMVQTALGDGRLMLNTADPRKYGDELDPIRSLLTYIKHAKINITDFFDNLEDITGDPARQLKANFDKYVDDWILEEYGLPPDFEIDEEYIDGVWVPDNVYIQDGHWEEAWIDGHYEDTSVWVESGYHETEVVFIEDSGVKDNIKITEAEGDPYPDVWDEYNTYPLISETYLETEEAAEWVEGYWLYGDGLTGGENNVFVEGHYNNKYGTYYDSGYYEFLNDGVLLYRSKRTVTEDYSYDNDHYETDYSWLDTSHWGTEQQWIDGHYGDVWVDTSYWEDQGTYTDSSVHINISNGTEIYTTDESKIGQDNYKKLVKGTKEGESVFGTDDNDMLLGGDGDDVLVGMDGDDVLVGGRGKDKFIIKNQEGPFEIRIEDFEYNLDGEKIDLTEFSNFKSINDLTITEGSAIVHLGDDQTIHMMNLTPQDLSEDDFIFSNDSLNGTLLVSLEEARTYTYLCNQSYKDGGLIDGGEWDKLLDSKTPGYTDYGYYGVLYKNINTGELVLVNRGVERLDVNVFINELCQLQTFLPRQLTPALHFMWYIQNNFNPEIDLSKITYIGDSLGGFLAEAQYFASGSEKCFTVNSIGIGTRHLLDLEAYLGLPRGTIIEKTSESKIINLMTENDTINALGSQIGTSYMLDLKNLSNDFPYFYKHHTIGNIYDVLNNMAETYFKEEVRYAQMLQSDFLIEQAYDEHRLYVEKVENMKQIIEFEEYCSYDVLNRLPVSLNSAQSKSNSITNFLNIVSNYFEIDFEESRSHLANYVNNQFREHINGLKGDYLIDSHYKDGEFINGIETECDYYAEVTFNGITYTMDPLKIGQNGYRELKYGTKRWNHFGNDRLALETEGGMLVGGLGDDSLTGSNENDVLLGGDGNNGLTGKEGNDIFVIKKQDKETITTITDFDPSLSSEKIDISSFDNVLDFNGLVITQEDSKLIVDLGNGESIHLLNISLEDLTEDNFIFYNYAPAASVSSSIVSEDSEVIIDVLAGANDLDGDGLFLTDVTNPENGTVIIVDGKLIYTPAENFYGEDTFSYTINDDSGGEVTKELTVTINPVEDMPTVDFINDFNVVSSPELQTYYLKLIAGEFPVIENIDGVAIDPGDVPRDIFKMKYGSEVNIKFKSAVSGHKNSMGWYKINEEGNIVNPELLFKNSHEIDLGETFNLGYQKENTELGFFIISNGFEGYLENTNTGLDIKLSDLDISKGNFEFRDIYGETANINSDNTRLYFVSNDGEEYMMTRDVFHSVGNDYALLNRDDKVHAGVTYDEEVKDLLIGFEDSYNIGDSDYNDVLFYLDLGEKNEAPGNDGYNLGINVRDVDSNILNSLELSIDKEAGFNLKNHIMLNDYDIENTNITLSYEETETSFILKLTGEEDITTYQGILDNMKVVDNGTSIENGIYKLNIKADNSESSEYKLLIGDNIVQGDDGDNVLSATEALDILEGSTGSDVFDFSNLIDSTDDNLDLIADFEHGQDLIDVSDLRFSELDFGGVLIFDVSDGITTVDDLNSDFAFQIYGEHELEVSDFIFTG